MRITFRRFCKQKTNLYGLSLEDLSAKLLDLGSDQRKYRSAQILDWVYKKGIQNFNEMKNIPTQLRNQLEENLSIGSYDIVKEQKSRDGTIKRALKLIDGQIIETVMMPYNDGRRTVCISSQAGCAMGCVFCATGQMGFSRQLTSIEIFEQVAMFSGELQQKGERLSNIVFMGMGEPLNNYRNVCTAIDLIQSRLEIGARHITISTVGIIPKIKQLAHDYPQIGLAISLHQSSNERRSALMPINNKYPIEELLEACRYYILQTNRRISFEWTLIHGETDQSEHAHELGKLLKGLLCHVNVIPLNPTGLYAGIPTSTQDVDQFMNILRSYNISVTQRMKKGVDIQAGCGQLTASLKKEEKKKIENCKQNPPSFN